MDTSNMTKRVRIFAKVAAISMALLGLCIVLSMLISIWLISYDSIWEILFTIVLAALAFAAGVYCLYVARNIWSNVSARVVRRVSLIVALAICLILMSFVEGLRTLQPSFWEVTWRNFMLPLGLIVGGGFYYLCNKLLIRWLALPKEPDSPRREKAVKNFFSRLAFFLFIAL